MCAREDNSIPISCDFLIIADSHANLRTGRRTADVSEKGRGGDYPRGRFAGKAGEVARHGQTAAGEAGNGPDRARPAPWPHGCAAEAEALSGSGAHGDFSDRRLHGDDWRPYRTVGDAASAQPRADRAECGDV